MDLEAFRIKRGLSYADLAQLIEVNQAKQARSYALGHSWPRATQLEKIISAAKGVSLAAMHKRRLDFLAHETSSAA